MRTDRQELDSCCKNVSGASCSDVRGFGRNRTNTMKLKRPKLSKDVKFHLRLEIVCPDELAETILSTLESMAHTRLRGDGKIYVLPLEEAVRISGGERGEEAV